MMHAKIITLGLLLSSTLAVAKIQLNTHAEFNNRAQSSKWAANITFQIDENQSLETYNNDKICIETELLAEEEMSSTLRFTIFVKNDAGEFEQLYAPVIIPNYTNSARISISDNNKTFSMTIKAEKIRAASEPHN